MVAGYSIALPSMICGRWARTQFLILAILLKIVRKWHKGPKLTLYFVFFSKNSSSAQTTINLDYQLDHENEKNPYILSIAFAHFFYVFIRCNKSLV